MGLSDVKWPKLLIFVFRGLRSLRRRRVRIIDSVVTFLAAPCAVTVVATLKALLHIRIFDCVTFFDNWEVLEIRLEELNEVVDFFVVVEATHSHAGRPKSLLFRENMHRFRRFQKKIISIVIDDMPVHGTTIDRQAIAAYQRKQTKRGLNLCRPGDIVLFSDVDEIPRAAKFVSIILHLTLRPKHTLFLVQQLYYYFLNGRVHSNESNWVGTAICRYATFGELWDYDCSVFREWTAARMPYSVSPPLTHRGEHLLTGGGWHFSYLGGAERIVEKIVNFEETTLDRSEFKDIESVRKKIDEGQDLFERGGHIEYCPIDRSYPSCIRKHPAKYARLVKTPHTKSSLRRL
jgi:beta-1,4-mannosyl-glycoprotein beta-1,4-N-acetylglucosaminyltransferase